MKTLGLLLLIIFTSCRNDFIKDSDKNKEVTYTLFESGLKADMNYDAIVAKFGVPAKDIGSGIHIYVYVLDDLTEIWIGYTSSILYARHMDKNHRLLNELI